MARMLLQLQQRDCNPSTLNELLYKCSDGFLFGWTFSPIPCA